MSKLDIRPYFIQGIFAVDQIPPSKPNSSKTPQKIHPKQYAKEQNFPLSFKQFDNVLTLKCLYF